MDLFGDDDTNFGPFWSHALNGTEHMQDHRAVFDVYEAKKWLRYIGFYDSGGGPQARRANSTARESPDKFLSWMTLTGREERFNVWRAKRRLGVE